MPQGSIFTEDFKHWLIMHPFLYSFIIVLATLVISAVIVSRWGKAKNNIFNKLLLCAMCLSAILGLLLIFLLQVDFSMKETVLNSLSLALCFLAMLGWVLAHLWVSRIELEHEKQLEEQITQHGKKVLGVLGINRGKDSHDSESRQV